MRLDRALLLSAAVLLTFTGCPAPEEPRDGGLDAGPPPSTDGGEPDAGPGPDAGPPPQDAGPQTCHSCHGSAANDAPPLDTRGRGEPGLPTVGAHQAHLRATTWHRPVACADCHVVPASVDAPGHLDPSPAEVVFSAVARVGAAPAAYDGGACGTACHGLSLHGGGNTDPAWTQGAATQAYCGDCHGVPPPAPHPQGATRDCSPCHANAAPGLGFVDPSRHVDGTLDVTADCSTCHGDATHADPFRDTQGRTDPSLRSVGAHRAHLVDSRVRRALTCADCHVVPQAVHAPGHVDSPLPAELTFSALATHRGALTPAWNGATCANTWCHGGALSGGAFTSPTWTRVDGAQVGCNGCHGYPPPPPHSTSLDCSACHGMTTPPGALIDLDGGHHLNGVIEATLPP